MTAWRHDAKVGNFWRFSIGTIFVYMTYMATNNANNNTSRNEVEGRELPKWKLKANWMLRQYALIWDLTANPYSVNFNSAFRDVFVQFFIDEGLLEKDAETCISFAEAEYEEYYEQHKDKPCVIAFFTAAEKWRWIIDKGLFSFLRVRFMEDGTIDELLYAAHYTEMALILTPKDGWWHYMDYEYCITLPCLPPSGYEGVDDTMT